MTDTPAALRLFDTHAHLDDEAFDADREEVIAALRASGVALCLCAAADMGSSERAVALAQAHPMLLASVGVHPHAAHDLPDSELTTLRTWAAHPRVVAIGEIGLDYHYDFQPRDAQMRCFRQQIELARQAGLPAIYHIREAWGDTLPLVRQGLAPGVMHCFSGSVETARECLDHGLYISLAGPVTFKNARNLHEVARYVPADRLLIETDSPYLSPEPVRGRRNQPAHVRHTAAAVAALRGVPVEELAHTCLENGCRLFGIDEFGVKTKP